MLLSLINYFNRGVQRTKIELCLMVQQQSPKAQYQQHQSTCGDQSASNMDDP